MNSKKKAIIILSPGFPENETNTACLPPQQVFVLGLKKHFPDLTIIIVSFQYPHMTLPYEWHHIQVIPFNGEFKRKFSKLFVWRRIWLKLKQLRRQYRIAGLLSFWCADCALVGKYFAGLYGLSHYCWILGQDAKKENRFVRWIKPNKEQLITISDFLASEFYKNHGIKPGSVIPIGVDPALFDPEPVQRDIDILGVGSLIVLKQFDVFINLIKEITNTRPLVRVVICGKGPQRDALQSQIVNLGLDHNVLMTGELNHAEVLRLMQRTNIFLHTAAYEGFGMVCLEALYGGARVISFCKPMNIIIDHWEIARNHEDMLKLLDEGLKNPLGNHQSVLPFSIDETVQSIMKLFDLKPNPD